MARNRNNTSAESVDVVDMPDFEIDDDAEIAGGIQELGPDDEYRDTDVFADDDGSEPIDITVASNAGRNFGAEEQAPRMMMASQPFANQGVPTPAAPLATVQQQSVVEAPIVVKNAPDKTYIVVTNEDVGPVFYGTDQPIELKKGVKYRVTEHIFAYLNERNLIWSVR